MTIFEKIINKEIEASIIYEDDMCIGMLDIHPAAKGHTLVIPKIKSSEVQVDHLWQIPDEYYNHCWMIAKKLALHIQDKLHADRIGVVVEGYGVPHAHIHLIPITGPHEIEVNRLTDRSIEAAKLSDTKDLLMYNAG